MNRLRNLITRWLAPELHERVAALETEFVALRHQVNRRDFGRRVVLADYGRVQAFIYAGDLEHRKFEDGSPIIRFPSMAPVMDHYWQERLPFAYIDVGCKYGVSVLLAAAHIADTGHSNRVIAFEPGLAAGLVEPNIRLNGMHGRVIFERIALSDRAGPTIMFGESGHAENCRIVNRDSTTETDSWVVDTVSLDNYLARHGVGDHLVAKVDTQGAEWQVIQGMRRALAERLVTYVTEFTPWAIGTTIDPVEFLSRIGAEADLVEMVSVPRLIRPPDYAGFTATLAAAPQPWADILVIPSRLPGRERLLERLLDHGEGGRDG